MNEKVTILFIEDSPLAVSMMRNALSESDEGSLELESAGTLAEGFARLRAGGIDLILLDLSLPDSSGLETFERTQEAVPDIPIVVLTGNSDQATAIKAVRSGAQDYLFKGEASAVALVRVIRYGIERKRSERERLRREKLEGVLEMAGASCHELNQPIQVISGHSELLLMRVSEGDPLRKNIRVIKQQVDRMAEITKKLNNITRYEARDYIHGVKIIDIDKASRATNHEAGASDRPAKKDGNGSDGL
jgi:DNA-binding response OmpR family regulator